MRGNKRGIGYVALMIVCGAVAVVTQGCAQEFGIKAYTNPIDTHTDSTTYKRVPLKCYFMNCAPSDEAQGS